MLAFFRKLWYPLHGRIVKVVSTIGCMPFVMLPWE